MKLFYGKMRYISLSFLLLCALLIGYLGIRDTVSNLIPASSENVASVPPQSVSTRRTVLVDTDGNVIHEFSVKNLDASTGTASIDVDELEEVVTVLYPSNPSQNVQFRNNNGTIQFKNAGGDWQDIASPSDAFHQVIVPGFDNISAVGIDSFTLEGGAFTNISSVGTTQTIIIGSTLSGKAFSEIQVSGESTLQAGQDEPLELTEGENVTIATDSGATPKKVTITSDAFSEMQIDGQSSLLAVGKEILEIVAGSNIVIETDVGADPKQLIITSTASGGSGSGVSGATFVTYVWKVTGGLTTGEVDLPRLPGKAGELKSVHAALQNTGTGGSDLVIDLLNDGGSILEPLSKPKILANSGSNQTSVSSSFTNALVSADDILTMEVESFPTGAEDLVVSAVYQITQLSALTTVTWQVNGPIITGTKIDLLRFPGVSGEILYANAVLENTGTGGSALVVDLNDEAGTSLYLGGGTKLTIPANSGTRQTDMSDDMNTTSLTTSNLLSMELESVPDDAEDLVIQVVIEHSPQKTLARAVWVVNGAVQTGSAIDLSRYLNIPGELIRFSAVLGNTGTGGDNLVVDLLRNGTSVYGAGGTKPSITANSGVDQTDVSTDIIDKLVSTTGRLSLEVETVPTGAQDLVCEAIVATTQPWNLTISDGVTDVESVIKINLDINNVDVSESSVGEADVALTVIELPFVDVDSAAYSLDGKERILHVTYTSSGAVTITVDSDVIAIPGRVFMVKDGAGNAGTFPISVTTEGAEEIEGVAPPYVINTNYGSQAFYSDGSELFFYP